MDGENQSDAQQLDASIQDVSLLDNTNTADATQQSDNSGDTAADKGADDAADSQNKDDSQAKAGEGDAKTTEAKDNNGEDSQASDDKTQDGQQDEQQQQPMSKEDRDSAARSSWIERTRNRNEAAQQLDQFYGPKTQEQLVQEGMNPAEANTEALRQEIAYNQERARVSELNSGMRAEAVEVFSDFPIFRELNADGSKNPEYDPEFAKQVEESYKRDARIQVDEQTGLVINADVSLYDYYKQMHNIYNRGASKGVKQRQDATAAMQSSIENPGGSSSTSQLEPGSLEEMEQRLGDVVIT